MYYIGNKKLPLDRPFSTGGFQYPAEWLRHSSEKQRTAIGITTAPEHRPKLRIDPPVAPQRDEGRERELLELLALTKVIRSVMLSKNTPPDSIMTVQDVQAEVQLLNIDNIRKFPCTRSKCEDFYTMWQRFGPAAARTIMIPVIWDGTSPRPSEFFGPNA